MSSSSRVSLTTCLKVFGILCNSALVTMANICLDSQIFYSGDRSKSPLQPDYDDIDGQFDTLPSGVTETSLVYRSRDPMPSMGNVEGEDLF